MTDRALRYRANSTPPPGSKICCLCGSRQNVEIGHVDGHEEHGEPENLVWTCRSCNVRSANVLRRAGLGRQTRQYNPGSSEGAKGLGQWLAAVLSMRGEGDFMPVDAAVKLIRATPPELRSEFAGQIWERRRKHFPACGRSQCADDVPF